MARTIILKLKSAGSRINTFSVSDNYGKVLIPYISKKEIIEGKLLDIEDNVFYLILKSIDKNCCNKIVNIPISTITNQEIADFKFETKNTASLWSHLTNQTVYNSYYGCTYPYIIEYPFSYEYQDEILQNIKDYTKVFSYLSPENGQLDINRKVQTDNIYFDKAVLYNDQQSTGVLKFAPKPQNNLKEYMKYPIYSSDSKTILFTKSDNFYQYNTLWSIVKDKSQPLFVSSCETLSIDKEVNQENMDYSTRVFKKEPLRAKDLKIRHILETRQDTHMISQFIIAPSQISYK